jgi:hypothetical protein
VQDIITNNPASIDPTKNFVLIVGFFYTLQTMYRSGKFKTYNSS